MATNSKKQKKQSKKDSEQYEVVSDKRFADVLSAPVFKPLSSTKHKQTEVDERFSGIENDKRFSILPGSGMDARGKKTSKSSAKASNNKETGDPKSSSTKNMKAIEMEERLEYLTKLARGEVSGSESEDEAEDNEQSIDDSDESDDDEEASRALVIKGKSPLDIPGGEESEEEVELGEATNRISILNCDWDNIRAEDLMVILQSFCPPGHQVLSVVVYPSDYGKERMAEEAKHGPRGIWNSDQPTSVENDDEDDDNSSEDDDEVDVDQEDYNDDDDSDNLEEVEEEENDNDDNEAESLYEHPDDNSHSANSDSDDEEQSIIDGDFSRPKDSVGLVMHEDLSQKHIRSSPKDKSESDFNEVALRQYELSKLRYYFAIATCDSIDTANTLYTELDGIEFEHSAMALELRFVPDDLDLSSREVRDVSHTLPTSSYKPPEFVINALQHTDVKCTWDEGEKTRSEKLTNFSAWRNLKESDFAQYIATSSDDDDQDEQGEEENEQEKKKRMRKLLLGDLASDSDDDADSASNNDKNVSIKSNSKLQKDDFFNEDKTLDALGEEDELVIEYIPEAEKSNILQRKRDKNTTLTPLEMEQQKQSEKKKLKKEKRQAEIEERMFLQQEQELAAQQQASAFLKKKNKRGKKQQAITEADGTDDADDVEELQESFRGRKQQQTQDLQKAKKKINKKTPFTAIADDLTTRQKGGVKSSTTVSTDFKLDVRDDRFKQVFEGNANFGIDRTAAEFRETTGMKMILKEQRKKRKLEETISGGHDGEGSTMEQGQGSSEMESLAKKLKQKYQQ